MPKQARAHIMDTEGALERYKAAVRTVSIQLALIFRHGEAWPAPAEHYTRNLTLRDLAEYDGPNANLANEDDLKLIASGCQHRAEKAAQSEGRTAINKSRQLAWRYLQDVFASSDSLQNYHAEFVAYKADFFSHKYGQGADPGLPSRFSPTPGDPVLRVLESEDFLLEVFNPFFNKRYGPSGPAMPKKFVWNAKGDLTPGWGGFMRELGRHVATIAFMQLAADENRYNYSYASTSTFTDQWTAQLDRMLYDWLEDAVNRGVIPTAEYRSAFDRFSNKTVYVPK